MNTFLKIINRLIDNLLFFFRQTDSEEENNDKRANNRFKQLLNTKYLNEKANNYLNVKLINCKIFDIQKGLNSKKCKPFRNSCVRQIIELLFTQSL